MARTPNTDVTIKELPANPSFACSLDCLESGYYKGTINGGAHRIWIVSKFGAAVIAVDAEAPGNRVNANDLRRQSFVGSRIRAVEITVKA